MKRKVWLKNKLKEVSILCSIDACVIMYSSYEPELEVWPDDNTAFPNVLNAFLTKSTMERRKFLLNRIATSRKGSARLIEDQEADCGKLRYGNGQHEYVTGW
ncbi:putative transcription factor MADS-type1 family [Helianthus anomalus]